MSWPWRGEVDLLARRVVAFVDAALAGGEHEPFSTLALDIHRWQATRDPVLASLVEAPPQRWEDIPAVPVRLFRDLRVGTVAPDEPHLAFHTSGTTGEGHGVHRLRSTALYDRGALGWARRRVPELDGRPVVALLEDPATAPTSSLSHMVAGFGPVSWHLRAGRVDVAGARRAVDAAGGPVFLAATSIALVSWLRAGSPALPRGSAAMVTGGFKGRDLQISEDELFAGARRALGEVRLVTEYGMTELSSQLWGEPGQPYAPPPWLRVVAVDPAGRRVVEEPGQLRFADLCNLDGTLAVETMDRGVVHEDGRVTLLGRLPAAPDRGCALPVEG